MTFKEIFAGERPLKWVSMLTGLAAGIWLIFWPELHTLPTAAAVVIPFAAIIVMENILRFFEWMLQGRRACPCDAHDGKGCSGPDCTYCDDDEEARGSKGSKSTE